jgi:hypothetical protein
VRIETRRHRSWSHASRVAAVFLRAVFRLLREHARAAGLEQLRGGAVAVIQRFGGALNLNVHIHALVLDGIFARDGAGEIAFHPARCLTTLDVAEVLAAVEPRIRRRLNGAELPDGDHERHAEDGGVDPWADEAPALAGLAAASVQGLVALGRHPGHALIVSVRRASRSIRGRSAPAMPGGMGWTCMRASSSRPDSAIGSSGSAATPSTPTRTVRALGARLAPARHTRAARPHGRRAGTARAEAPVGRRHDAHRVRSGRVPGAAGRTGSTATGEPDPVLRDARARAAWRPEVVPRPPSGQVPRLVILETTAVSSRGGHGAAPGAWPALGGSDAAHVRVLCVSVLAVWSFDAAQGHPEQGRGVAAACASSRSSRTAPSSAGSCGIFGSRRICPSPVPPVRRRCSRRRARCRPTSTNRPPECRRPRTMCRRCVPGRHPGVRDRSVISLTRLMVP